MRRRGRYGWQRGLGLVLLCMLSACAARHPVHKPKVTPLAETPTPMPTVPPSAPTPEPGASPLPTRPVGTNIKPKKGELIGPVISFFGAARADGNTVEPVSVDKKGIPTYQSAVGSGFMLVIEAKPGKSGLEPGRTVFSYKEDDPTVRPDLEVETSRDMGNGSPEVCDRRRPNIGGMPGIWPPDFSETQRVSNAINDFGCRFETFIESSGACTLDKSGDFSFVNKDSSVQFCMIVARAYVFPEGDTILSVRLRDSAGNPGPIKQMRIHRPAMPPRKPVPAKPAAPAKKQ